MCHNAGRLDTPIAVFERPQLAISGTFEQKPLMFDPFGLLRGLQSRSALSALSLKMLALSHRVIVTAPKFRDAIRSSMNKLGDNCVTEISTRIIRDLASVPTAAATRVSYKLLKTQSIYTVRLPISQRLWNVELQSKSERSLSCSNPPHRLFNCWASCLRKVFGIRHDNLDSAKSCALYSVPA